MKESDSQQQEKKGFRLNRKLSVFLICILLSTLFWFLVTLSENYTTVVRIPVEYFNLPGDKVVVNELPEQLDVRVHGPGFDLLRYKLRGVPDPMFVDVARLEYRKGRASGFFLPNDRLEAIRSDMDADIVIDRVMRDTINFRFDERISKQVKVVPDLNLEFEKQYKLIGNIRVVPESITVSGARSVIHDIEQIKTVRKSYTGLNDTVFDEVRLNMEGVEDRLLLSEQQVYLTIPVERYTEGQYKLPVETKGLPEKYKIKLFPDSIEVTYLIAFSDFEKVSREDFRAIVDFDEIDTEAHTSARVDIQAPKIAEILVVNPQRVRYILMK